MTTIQPNTQFCWPPPCPQPCLRNLLLYFVFAPGTTEAPEAWNPNTPNKLATAARLANTFCSLLYPDLLPSRHDQSAGQSSRSPARGCLASRAAFTVPVVATLVSRWSPSVHWCPPSPPRCLGFGVASCTPSQFHSPHHNISDDNLTNSYSFTIS